MRRVLAIDVGGSHVKLEVTGRRTPRKFASGPELTPRSLVRQVKRMVADWPYDVVSLGYPGLVVHGRVAGEPRHLGRGWVGFDFARAFGCPVRVINDAAMQALGSFRGGRMLFLGLGTGLGSAMVVDGRIEAMELGHLPYRKGRSFEDYLGAAGLARLGQKKWRRHVSRVLELLRAALEPDSVVMGGGNARRLRHLPSGVRLGSNARAFAGAFRLWATPARRSRDGAAARVSPAPPATRAGRRAPRPAPASPRR